MQKNLRMFITVVAMLQFLMAPISADVVKPNTSAGELGLGNLQLIAEELKLLGIFKGTNKGFELDREPNRLEGAVMFVRLLGKEAEALEKSYDHPFTDVVDWADDYVGYMYEFDYTKGIGNNLFGSDSVLTANAYMTFVLRAMDYKDNVDFTWETALSKAQKLKIISYFDYTSLFNKEFLRGDVAFISYKSLTGNMADGDLLIYRLLKAGAINMNVLFDTSLEQYAKNYRDMQIIHENPFNMDVIKSGDQVGNMMVEDITLEEDPYVSFVGEVTVSGRYTYDLAEDTLNNLRFYPDEASSERLPRCTEDRGIMDIHIWIDPEIEDLFLLQPNEGEIIITIRQYDYRGFLIGYEDLYENIAFINPDIGF